MATGIISHMQADFANSRDSLHLPSLVERLHTRLQRNDLSLQDVVADTGYSNGFNYAFLEQRGITPWILVFGAYKPEVAGFTYHADVDQYRCRAAKPLPFRSFRPTADGVWTKHYRACYQDCQHCPFKKDCVPSADQKQLVRSAFDAAYRRAWHRQRSPQGQYMRRVRQRTVEPVFGNLLQHYGLRRVGTKGRTAAHKTMLLSALAYNLQKLLKHQPKRVVSLALALQSASLRLVNRLFEHCLRADYLLFEYSLNGGVTEAEFCNRHEHLAAVTTTVSVHRLASRLPNKRTPVSQLDKHSCFELSSCLLAMALLVPK